MSTDLPSPARTLLLLAGAAGIGLALFELGGALWPPNLASVFFGIIIAGAISVGLSFISGALFAPDARWTVLPGRIHVEAKLFGRTAQQGFAWSAIEQATIEVRPSDSGPDAYGLRVHLASPVSVSPLFVPGRSLADGFRILLSPRGELSARTSSLQSLLSPDFPTREAAEAALSLLRG